MSESKELILCECALYMAVVIGMGEQSGESGAA